MNPGDVIFWRNFEFADGDKSDKLLVVIGKRDIDEMLLTLQATSQPRSYRPDNHGCHSGQSVARFKDDLGGFKKPTWILFDPPEFATIGDAVGAGAFIEFTLKPQHLAFIVNCYKKSPNFFQAATVFIR